MSPSDVIEQQNNRKITNQLIKQIAKGGGISFTGNIIGKGFNFLLHILLTHILGVEAYGLYALGRSIIEISQTFSSLGLTQGVVRFGSIYRGENNEAKLKGTLLAALTVSFLSGTSVSIMLFFLSGFFATHLFHEPTLIPVIKVLAFSLPFYTLMMVASYSARVFRRMEYEVGIRRVSHPLSNLLLVGISFSLGFRLLGAVYAFLISSFLAAILGIYFLWQLFPKLVSGLKPEVELKNILFYSSTVLLVGLTTVLLYRTDRIMLGAFGMAKDVGIYNAAAIMSAQMAIFLTSFNAIFSPTIADLYNQGNMDQLNKLLKTITKWIFALTIPTFLVLISFPRQIMGLFGMNFKVGGSVLIVLGLAQIVNASVGSVGFMLIMTGKQKLEFLNNVVLCGVNIFLNIILIPRYGILGAAIAMGISIALVNLARLLEVYYLHRIHPYKFSYWKPITAGVTAIFSFIILRQFIRFTGWAWLMGAILLVIFYVMVFLLLGLNQEEKVILKAVRQRFVNHQSGR